MRIIEFTVGKKKLELVAGLVWHPVHTTGSARAKEIRELSKTSALDLKVLRGTESPHVGFAKKSEGGKAGQISAAAVIADTISASESVRNFLVALRIPDDKESLKLLQNRTADQYIFVAVHDGVILADGDMVGTRDEVRVRLTGDSSYEAWEVIICPGDWGVARSQDKDFADIVSEDSLKSPKRWALKEVTIAWKKAILPLILIAVVATGSTFGFKYWTQKKAAEAELLRIQSEEVAKGQRATIAEPTKPWPTMPFAVSFAAACSAAFQRVGMTAGNWQIKDIECSEGKLTVNWAKPNESAWISHLQAVRPDAQFSVDGLSASVSVPVTTQASNDFTEVLPSQNGISLRYYDLASRYGMAVRVEASAAPATPAALPGQQAGQQAPVAPLSWAVLNVQVTTNIDPVQAAGVLSYPGLRLQKITYANKSGLLQYQLSGVQYVRP